MEWSIKQVHMLVATAVQRTRLEEIDLSIPIQSNEKERNFGTVQSS